MMKSGPGDAKGEPSDICKNASGPAAVARQEGLAARLARKVEVYADWLTDHPMTKRDWTIWEVRRTEAFLRAVTNGLVWHLDGLVPECPCCAL